MNQISTAVDKLNIFLKNGGSIAGIVAAVVLPISNCQHYRGYYLPLTIYSLFRWHNSFPGYEGNPVGMKLL